MVRSGLAVAAICFLISPTAARSPLAACDRLLGPELTARTAAAAVVARGPRLRQRRAVGRFQGVVGCVRPISRLTYANDTCASRFRRSGKRERRSAICASSKARAVRDDYRSSGTRIPSPPCARPPCAGRLDVGAVVRLFNGTDLTGCTRWAARTSGARERRAFERQGGANLVTGRRVH